MISVCEAELKPRAPQEIIDNSEAPIAYSPKGCERQKRATGTDISGLDEYAEWRRELKKCMFNSFKSRS